MNHRGALILPKSSNKLTLKDVAGILGVSDATVSNAFNRPGQLSRELRKNIIERCKEIGYLGPNAISRNLKAGKTGIIGVMLSNYLSYSFSDEIAHQFLIGLAEVFEQREYNFLVMPSRDNVEMASGYESFVNGFIVYGPPQEQEIEHLVNLHKSIVTVDFDVEGYASVNVDNFTGARDCALHAINGLESENAIGILGLRINDQNKICHIDDGELFDEATITIQRLRGYQSAANSSDRIIKYQDIWNVPDNTSQLGYEAAKEALSQTKGLKVLLCMSDRLAIGALKAAHDLGINVPEDLKITGFDDISDSRYQQPALTTVRQKSNEKGKIAAEIFLGLREEKSVVLPADLVIRESCP